MSSHHRIFISHINEEAAVADVLKDWIESAFAGLVSVYVSSDPKNIPTGKNWLASIFEEINRIDIMIMLCSFESIKRPWINFQIGAGSIIGKPIIPLCYMGFKKNNLPAPLSLLQALDLKNERSLVNLLSKIRGLLSFNNIAQISYDNMFRELEDAASSILYVTDTVAEYEIKEKLNGKKLTLDDNEVEILKLIAQLGDQGSGLADLEPHLKLNKVRLDFHFDNLVEKGLIDAAYYIGTSPEYYLTNTGRRYLVSNNLI